MPRHPIHELPPLAHAASAHGYAVVCASSWSLAREVSMNTPVPARQHRRQRTMALLHRPQAVAFHHGPLSASCPARRSPIQETHIRRSGHNRGKVDDDTGRCARRRHRPPRARGPPDSSEGRAHARSSEPSRPSKRRERGDYNRHAPLAHVFAPGKARRQPRPSRNHYYVARQAEPYTRGSSRSCSSDGAAARRPNSS